MIRSAAQTRLWRLAPSAIYSRPFSSSSLLFKKKGKGAPEQSSKIEVEAHAQDVLHDIDNKFANVISDFSDKAKHLKAGDAEISKWENLQIEVHGANIPLKNIANIQIKGGNRIIELVAFDPKDIKHIQSSVLSKLNITPQQDPKNKQALVVPLQSKKKDEFIKQLKTLHDDFRNSHKLPSSLAVVRSALLNNIKKAKNDLTVDEFKKHNSTVEKAYKDYATKLQQVLKSAENLL